jgi:hypothetical protein
VTQHSLPDRSPGQTRLERFHEAQGAVCLQVLGMPPQVAPLPVRCRHERSDERKQLVYSLLY